MEYYKKNGKYVPYTQEGKRRFTKNYLNSPMRKTFNNTTQNSTMLKNVVIVLGVLLCGFLIWKSNIFGFVTDIITGLTDNVKSILGLYKDPDNVKTSHNPADALKAASDKLEKQGHTPDTSDVTNADIIYNYINSPSLFSYVGGSNNTPTEEQKKVYDLLIGMSATKRGLIYIAYGIRYAPNRGGQFPLNLFSQTKGDLIYHISNYFEGTYKTNVLAQINSGKNYLHI